VVTANHHDGSAQDDVAGNEGGLAYLIGLFEDANLHANHTKRDYDKVLNSLIMKITPNEDDINDILQTLR